MCEPATIIGGIGLGLNLLGNQQASKAAAGEAGFNSAVAASNAAEARRTANDIRALGHEAEVQQMRQVRQLTGRQVATYAANNVDVNTGTPLDTIAESAGEGMADASRIRSNAIREAWGFEQEAVQQDAASRFYRKGAKNIQKAGILTGAGSAIGGGYQLWKGK